MKVRPLRGSFREAMELVADVAPNAEAVQEWAGLRGRVEVSQYIFDDRNGWDTHIIVIDGKPCGFSDGPLVSAKTTTPSED